MKHASYAIRIPVMGTLTCKQNLKQPGGGAAITIVLIFQLLLISIRMNTSNTSLHKKKRLLCYFGLSAAYVWAGTIIIVFVLRFLFGYNVPEELLSVYSTSSALGYSCLIKDIFYPVRRSDTLWKSRFSVNLIIGCCLIILGVYGILSANQGVFTYVCLLLGMAITALNVGNIAK